MADPVGDVHPDVGFIRLDTVDRWFTAQANGCCFLRVQTCEESRKQAWLQQRLVLRTPGLEQALAVTLVPLETCRVDAH